MRARLPDESGYVANAGVRIHYEVHGTGQPTLLLLPTWAIVDSRHWKMQVPFLARNYRVITLDPRGNGRSDRPADPAAYADAAFASDIGAVLDATGTERAVLGAFCSGFPWALLFAAAHPQRVTGIIAIAPTLPLPPASPWQPYENSFDDVVDAPEGWAKENRHYWRRDWRGYVEFFMSQIASEPHSTKAYDDLVEWGMQTDAETMLCDADAPHISDEREAVRLCRSLDCPVLVIGGDQDKIVPPERMRRIAELTNAELLVIEGGGHAPHVRYPVAVNHAIRDFAGRVAPRPRQPATWPATHGRRRRALWVSSPIGLGHVQRDLAIARALRQRVPDLEIHWWAQPPVTEVLAGAGEIIHPASAALVSESAHWESESADHDLPAFYAFRRMDEILCANYLLFDDVARDTRYDLWVGDECWEIDYFLHENPERKIAPYVFMTDVIGFLPVHDDGTSRHRASVRLLPASPPLGTAALRRAPARSLPSRAADGLRHDHTRRPGYRDAGGPGAERHRSWLPEDPAWRRGPRRHAHRPAAGRPVTAATGSPSLARRQRAHLLPERADVHRGSAKLGVWIRRNQGRLWCCPILRWSCWSGRPDPASRSGRRSITVRMRWSRRTGCARWWVAASTTWMRRPTPLPCSTR